MIAKKEFHSKYFCKKEKKDIIRLDKEFEQNVIAHLQFH